MPGPGSILACSSRPLGGYNLSTGEIVLIDMTGQAPYYIEALSIMFVQHPS